MPQWLFGWKIANNVKSLVAINGLIGNIIQLSIKWSGEWWRVSRAFPSWNRSILAEIYLCHACSDHETEDGNARVGALG
eukprot:COSAG01_NODE_561_length_15460_cov_95.444307_3_plen_79_part_00